MVKEEPKTDEPSSQRSTIDATFRNGSLTAIGVVVGFSLSFMSRWAASPGEWSGADLFAVTAITLGIAFQIKSLADLLSITSLVLARYNQSVRIFMIGLVLVATEVVIAIFDDLIGYGGIALQG
jgi:hypothetical protein